MCRAILLTLVLLAPKALAADHVVGPPGSGAPFSEIQAAIDAALPGDRVLVLPGDYTGTAFVDKAIELIGSGSASTILRSSATFFPGFVEPPLAVADLPAGARTRVAGLTFSTLGPVDIPVGSFASVVDCAGRVELADLVLDASALPSVSQGSVAGVLYLEDCAQVVATAVKTSVPSLPLLFSSSASPVEGLAGAVVLRSSAWFTGCEFRGAEVGMPFPGFGGNGGAGVSAVDASLHLGRSVLRGGRSSGLSFNVPADGGAGLLATGSEIVVHGGSGNAIQGADAFQAPAFVVGLGNAGDAVVLDGTSSLELAEDVLLDPGAPSGPLSGGQAIVAAPGATVVTLAERRPTLWIDPPYAPLGSPVSIAIEGEGGSVQVRGLALSTGPALTISGVSNALLLDFGTLVLLPPLLLGPGGAASIPSGVPAVPALAGLAIVEQSLQVSVAGVSLSPPVLLSLGL